MVLQELASWYQKKIGTYDKQQWERTVEQRILLGLTHVPRKTAKLKTELIDVDLVRGSSFPKAKPKHGLLTVARLGFQRLVLLPVYWRWWVQQTSPKAYSAFLLLYLLQAFNIGLYCRCCHYQTEDTTDNVSASEVFVPSFMMIVLSIIHSQIVCTHNGQPSDFHDRSRRRVKRTKRRPLALSRMRMINSDTKSQHEDSEKLVGYVEKNKFNARARFRRSGDDASRASERAGSEESFDSTSRIRVCFKEPTDEENSIDQEPQVNERGREGTPMDDDGFESLNGNGSSENGDEPAEEIISADIVDSAKNNNKYADLYLKCSDKSAIESDVIQNKDIYESNFNNMSCEVLSCDENIPTVDLCETFVDRKSNFRLIELHNENEKDLENKIYRSELNSCNNENNNKVRKDGKTGGESTWPADDTVNRSHVLQRRQSAHVRKVEHESDSDGPPSSARRDSLLKRRRGSQNLLLKCPAPAVAADESSFNSSCCDDSEGGVDDGMISSPGTGGSCCENPHLTEGGTTSATDYMGVTTNSEECSYSSDMDVSDSHAAPVEPSDQPFAWEFAQSPTVILSPSCAASDKVSCTMWESKDVKKADLSVLDISSAIIARVEAMPDNMDYFYLGTVCALLLSLVPPTCRLIMSSADTPLHSNRGNTTFWADLEIRAFVEHVYEWTGSVMDGAFGTESCERTVMVIALLERFALAELFFFLLVVAERTFKQRFLYAKLFSHLTSFRRARKSELPHFRLNKVRNIKTWLSVRSYLRKRGPQRSVDMLVSAAFIITLLLLTFLIVEILKDSVRLNSQYNMEALCWCLALGVFLLRFMTLGTDINRKYCNLSVLITEQINLYLQIEQKPNKKEELMVANSVLKLAADLLKELESPFKISGLSANPYLYNITNVVILSALSGVLSEILGFKLKLHKIKIK